jgi:hypothetical protein
MYVLAYLKSSNTNIIKQNEAFFYDLWCMMQLIFLPHKTLLPAFQAVSQLPFRHSVQAKRDTESSIFSKFWMPTFVGMTVFMALFTIMTQSHSPG